MISKKVLRYAFGLTLVVLLLAGCVGGPAGPTATPTAIPPTPTFTPMPLTPQPTDTPIPTDTPTPTPTKTPEPTPPTTQTPPPPSVSVFDNVPSAIIELKENGVEIEGHYVEFPCEAGEFEKVLGQPNRILSKANNIMVWDDLGVFIYERPHSGLIVQFSVAHGPRDFDFYPQTLYAGSVVFDSSVITSETGSSYLKQQGFEESWAWQMPFGAGTIYIDIDEDTDTVSETSFTISASQ